MFVLKGIWNNRNMIGSVIKDENTLLDDSYNSNMLFEIYNEESDKIDIIDLWEVYSIREEILGVVCREGQIVFKPINDDTYHLYRLLTFSPRPTNISKNVLNISDNLYQDSCGYFTKVLTNYTPLDDSGLIWSSNKVVLKDILYVYKLAFAEYPFINEPLRIYIVTPRYDYLLDTNREVLRFITKLKVLRK